MNSTHTQLFIQDSFTVICSVFIHNPVATIPLCEYSIMYCIHYCVYLSFRPWSEITFKHSLAKPNSSCRLQLMLFVPLYDSPMSLLLLNGHPSWKKALVSACCLCLYSCFFQPLVPLPLIVGRLWLCVCVCVWLDTEKTECHSTDCSHC